MKQLEKVKEALDNIARIDEYQPVGYNKDHEFAIKLIKAQQNQAKEALAELNGFMEGLEDVEKRLGIVLKYANQGAEQRMNDINLTFGNEEKSKINVIREANK